MSTTVSDRRLLAASAMLFFTSAAGTVILCRSMSAGMPMPGGWTMSMAWMRMPGQTWFGAAASFLAMWLVMMVAMMMPSLVPSLSRDQKIVVGASYFGVWTLFGLAVYPIGVMVTVAEMRWSALARSVPAATAVVIVLAGFVQMSAWKVSQLGRCRDTAECAANPWQHGLRLGVRCILCCCGFMAVLLVAGVMDLRAMAAVTAAITAERLAPKPDVVARALGLLLILAGALIAIRA